MKGETASPIICPLCGSLLNKGTMPRKTRNGYATARKIIRTDLGNHIYRKHSELSARERSLVIDSVSEPQPIPDELRKKFDNETAGEKP